MATYAGAFQNTPDFMVEIRSNDHWLCRRGEGTGVAGLRVFRFVWLINRRLLIAR